MRRRDFLLTAPALGACTADRAAGGAGLPDGILDVRSFGAAGDGRTNDAGAIVRAIEALERTGGALLFGPGTFVIEDDIDVPVGVGCIFVNGAVLHVARGKRLRVAGTLDAGRHRIFDGPGVVVVEATAADALQPEWWGAIADGETDSTAALQATMSALAAGSVRTLALGRGSYRVAGTLELRLDGARIIGNRTQMLWTEDVDGLRLIGRHIEVRDIGIRGPGFSRSAGVGLRITRPETWPATTDRYELADLHVMNWNVGVRLENLELVHAVDWRIDYNRRNMDLIDGAFNTFVNCRWANVQGDVSVLVSGAEGVGNGGAAAQNTFIQCEWLETPDDATALVLGESRFPSPGNLFLKSDFEKGRGALGVRVHGAGNVFIAPFFHALAAGIELGSADDLLLIAPRFTNDGFQLYTARAPQQARITIQGGIGALRAGGAQGGVRTLDAAANDADGVSLRAPGGASFRLEVTDAGELRVRREPAR